MAALPAESDQILERLKSYLKLHQIRNSRSREQVLNLMLSGPTHLSLNALMTLGKKKRLGEATIYRALRVFQSAGIVTRIEDGLGQVSYEIPRDHHDHMICNGCGLILEFHSPVIERMQERIASKAGFNIQYHRHEIFGLCDRCYLREAHS